MVITPRAPLPLDAAIELIIDKGLRGEGPLLIDQRARLDMRTYGPLRLERLTCPRVFDTTLGKCQAHRDITVVLNNPVMPDEFRSHVALGGLPKAPATHAKVGKGPLRATSEQAIGADPDFNKRYRITLKAGMTDIYGQRLAKDVFLDVDTEPPFTLAAGPAANRHPPSDDSQDSDDSEGPHRLQLHKGVGGRFLRSRSALASPDPFSRLARHRMRFRSDSSMFLRSD